MKAAEDDWNADRKHQRSQQHSRDEGHALHGRTEKVQEIFRAGMFETLSMVVQKRTNGATQGHERHPSGGLKSGNQTDQVTNQNEDKDDCEKWRVRLAVMTD